MRKIFALMLSAALVFSLAACSNTQQSRDSNPASSEESSQVAESTPVQTAETESLPEEDNMNASDTETASTETESEESNILIAYFTYGENAELPDDVDASATASIQIFNGEVTGNTGVMAHMIAEASGGELFSIRTVEPYPDSYDDTIDVGQSEKNNGIRPELSTHIENLDQYRTVFVGFPNWWYGMPMVMYSFFDEYDFSGKTVIPFCTSGGSAFSDAIEEIKDMEPNATVLDGLHIGASSVTDAESRVNEWVAELDVSK
ncbi:flavodoxin [Bianquea renquensis]|jgi:flavodoxins|uniref:Flavodoxin n=1 Tax=Bianquea renquensis TaxID=2763661 RepID=A0A926DV88_9FIRM|nr:flavodoxin [Bianquea renquensis]MBC8543870.1 flavodoxin [Bianquea renquensis]